MLVILVGSLRHSAIVESCISGFNVETNLVTYWFVGESGVKRFVILSVLEFVECLVKLILDKNF